MRKLYWLFVIIILIDALSKSTCKKTTLQLVIGVFRHGDRTNEHIAVYPKDPYLNTTYYPYGPGELTNAGKKRLYELGKKLRKRYDGFLDPLYRPEDLFATSSETNRAKMSLQLMLAGLYPPFSTGLEWDTQLNWSPIPFTSGEHISYLPPLLYCTEYQKVYADYMKSEEVQQMVNKYHKWFSYLSFHTGVKIKSIFNFVPIYHHLEIQRELGMKIPLWTFPIHPHTTRNAYIDCLNTLSATAKLRQLYGGKFLKKIIKIIENKTTGNLKPFTQKLYLFSGHDINILTTLSALNAHFNHVPPYGACLLIELHKKNKMHFIRIFYEDYTSENLKQLNVRGCLKDCPINKFLQLTEENIPVDDSLCNNGSITMNIFDT